MKKNDYPILEFDNDKDAFINPTIVLKTVKDIKHIPNKLVICFFHETINRLIEEETLTPFVTIKGENSYTFYQFKNEDVLVVPGYIGAPLCGGILDEAIAFGVDKVMFCGGAGSLVQDITLGKLVVIDQAIRDEGMSYHYKAPSREVTANSRVQGIIREHLDSIKADYVVGKTWTTDAFYRETRERIQRRRAEGAILVEMEQSALMAISEFRQIDYGAIIYGGDDLSTDTWDNRKWHSRHDVRENLLYLCKDIVKKL